MTVIDVIPQRLREKFLFAALAPIQFLLPAATIESSVHRAQDTLDSGAATGLCDRLVRWTKDRLVDLHN